MEPGQLLAGEYPRNKDEASSRAKLAALTEAGVNTFIDLTQEGIMYNSAETMPASYASLGK